MEKIFLLFMRVGFQIGTILLIFMSCKTDIGKGESNRKEEIITVLDLQAEAWNKGDIASFMKGYEKSDSLQFITKRGRTLGWTQVFTNYSKHYPTQKEMGKLYFENLIITDLSDSLSQVYGNWKLDKDSIVGGNFSLIMKLKNKEWKIIIDHTW